MQKARPSTLRPLPENDTDFDYPVVALFHFTGSWPPLQNGWQRNIRFMPIQVPFSAPYFSTACFVYSEHVGSNLQAGGKKGETIAL
jgi:hypothetical protein